MNNKDMPYPDADKLEQLTENARWYFAANPVFATVPRRIMEDMASANAKAALAELNKQPGVRCDGR